MVVKITRGQIVLVELDPVRGSEQGRTRPAVIIQNNIGNKFSPTTIVAPLTSKIFSKQIPTNVFASMKETKLDKDATIMLSQIRTIDRSRIVKKYKSLDSFAMQRVDTALKLSLGLI